MAKLRAQVEAKRARLTVPLAAPSWPGFNSVYGFTNYVQTQSNYCGPAAAQSTLSLWGFYQYQNVLASEMGTSGLTGSSPMAMSDAMNTEIGNYYGSPGTYYQTYRDLSGQSIYNYLSQWPDAGIMLVYANRIWYPNAGSAVMHYLVITGFNPNYNGLGPVFQVWDPEGYWHTFRASDYASKSVAGLAIMPVYRSVTADGPAASKSEPGDADPDDIHLLSGSASGVRGSFLRLLRYRLAITQTTRRDATAAATRTPATAPRSPHPTKTRIPAGLKPSAPPGGGGADRLARMKPSAAAPATTAPRTTTTATARAADRPDRLISRGVRRITLPTIGRLRSPRPASAVHRPSSPSRRRGPTRPPRRSRCPPRS